MNWVRHIFLLTVILLQPWSLMADDGSSGNVLTTSDTLRIPAAEIQSLSGIDEATGVSAVVPSTAPVTITEGGAMTLVSGKSVILKPGTRVEAGGRLVVKVTPANHPKRHRKKVAASEEPDSLPLKNQASAGIEKTFCVNPLPESGSISALLCEAKGLLPTRVKTSEEFIGFIYLKKSWVQVQQPWSDLFSLTFSIGTGWGEQPANIRIMRT